MVPEDAKTCKRMKKELEENNLSDDVRFLHVEICELLLERGNIINYFNGLFCTMLLILMDLEPIFKVKSLNHKLGVTGIAAFYSRIHNKLKREAM